MLQRFEVNISCCIFQKSGPRIMTDNKKQQQQYKKVVPPWIKLIIKEVCFTFKFTKKIIFLGVGIAAIIMRKDCVVKITTEINKCLEEG